MVRLWPRLSVAPGLGDAAVERLLCRGSTWMIGNIRTALEPVRRKTVGYACTLTRLTKPAGLVAERQAA